VCSHNTRHYLSGSESGWATPSAQCICPAFRSGTFNCATEAALDTPALPPITAPSSSSTESVEYGLLSKRALPGSSDGSAGAEVTRMPISGQRSLTILASDRPSRLGIVTSVNRA